MRRELSSAKMSISKRTVGSETPVLVVPASAPETHRSMDMETRQS